MRVGEDGALRDDSVVATTQPEGEPVANGVGHGVPVAFRDKPVLIFTDEVFELAPRLGLGFCYRNLSDLVDE